jgi:hypothetical protein
MRVVFFIAINLFLRPCFAQDTTSTNDSVITLLSNIDLSEYNDKISDSIIRKIPSNYRVDFQSSKKFGYPYMAVLTFLDRPYLEIDLYYEDLKYTNPNGISKRKKARRIRKEKVAEINIYNSSLCVNGCD